MPQNEYRDVALFVFRKATYLLTVQRLSIDILEIFSDYDVVRVMPSVCCVRVCAYAFLR